MMFRFGIFLSTIALGCTFRLPSRTAPLRLVRALQLAPYSSWSYKSRPEDFIVIEDRALENFGVENVKADAKELTMTAEEAKIFLFEKLTDNQVGDLQQLSLKSFEGLSGVDGLILTITPPLSKVDRTRFHQCIRAAFPMLDSKTEIVKASDSSTELADATFIQIYPKGAKSIADNTPAKVESGAPGVSSSSISADGKGKSNAKSGGKKSGKKKAVVQRWDKNKSDYQHFTVVKRLLSTPEMIDRLARHTSVLPTRFEYCGSKDSRAITLQRLSAWRLESGTLEKINSCPDSQVMSVRDIVPEKVPLNLGDLSGNFFAITLRKNAVAVDRVIGNAEGDEGQQEPRHNCITTAADLDVQQLLEGVKNLAAEPFVNVFGPQRFGSPLAINPLVGQQLLRGDYKAAVFTLLMSPTSDREVKLGSLSMDHLTQWFPAREIEAHSDVDDGYSSKFFQNLTAAWKDYQNEVSGAIEKQLQSLSPGSSATATVDDESREDNALDGDLEGEIDLSAPREYDGDAISSVEGDLSSEDVTTGTDIDTGSGTSGMSRKQLKTQMFVLKNIESKAACITALLEGRDFQVPRNALFVQKQLLKKLSEELQSARNAANTLPLANNDSCAMLSKVDYRRVLASLPKSLRQLFVNSYQSLIWNDEALKRMGVASQAVTGSSRSKRHAAVGDMVLVDIHKQPLTAWHVAAENISLSANHVPLWSVDDEAAAPSRTAGSPAPLAPASSSSTSSSSSGIVESLLIQAESNSDELPPKEQQENASEEAASASNSNSIVAFSIARYHIVTDEEAAKKLFPIDCVILPLPGTLTHTPPNIQQQLTADGMHVLVDGSHPDWVFRMPGAYRHIVSTAKNVRFAPVPAASKTAEVDIEKVEDVPSIKWEGPHEIANKAHSQVEVQQGGESTVSAVDNAARSEFPFSSRVENLWKSGALPELLEGIYRYPRSGALAPPQPPSVISSVEAVKTTAMEEDPVVAVPPIISAIAAYKPPSSAMKNLQSSPTASLPIGNVEKSTSTASYSGDYEGLRICFSLCASTYATTYLEWLISRISDSQDNSIMRKNE